MKIYMEIHANINSNYTKIHFLIYFPFLLLPHSMEHRVPLSYEQALAMGRSGGRVLPSPILNGYKPKGGGGGGGGSAIGLHSSRHSDSDDEDWC